MIGTILDIVIAFLLFATVIYCIKLSKKITLIHQGKEELNQFIRDFNDSITRAEENISELKNLGSETEERLQEHVQKARYLANDLSFLMDKGEKISNTLEHNLTMSKAVSNNLNANRSKLTQDNRNRLVAEKDNQAARKKAQEDMIQQRKRKEIEKLLKMNENTKLATSKNINQPSNSRTSSFMTHEKRKALDDVLEQIAIKKSGRIYDNNQSSQSTQKRNVVNTKPLSGGNRKEVVFDKRRLSEALKTAQNSE